MFGIRSSWKAGLLAVAGLLLAGSAAQAGPVGLRLRSLGILPPYPGFGYYYPGFYAARPFAYSVYGPGFGYSVRYGYGVYGFSLGYGGLAPAYGMGYGMYGPGVGGLAGTPVPGLGAPGLPPGNAPRGVGADNPPAPEQERPGPLPQRQPQRPRPGQIPQPTPVPPEEQEKQAAEEDNTARVTVIVPDGAELWFNDAKTNQTGKQREFITAPLTPGKDFRYRIKARWMEDGKPVELTQTIKVRANSLQTIDFTKLPKAPVPEK